MKPQILQTLQQAPRLKKRDFFLTLVPALLWALALFSRPYLIQPHCAAEPHRCSIASINPIDRSGMGLERSDADGFSYFTQNLSGVMALSLPAVWNGALALSGTLAPTVALSQTVVDLVLVAQTAAWNGLLTESARLITQRARPFLYIRPEERNNPANYTSFYSGHTSFAAAANTALFLTLLSRQAPLIILVLVGSAGQALILSTAFFRVLAGRHFISDVLAGAIAGTLVALFIAYFHRNNSRGQAF